MAEIDVAQRAIQDASVIFVDYACKAARASSVDPEVEGLSLAATAAAMRRVIESAFPKDHIVEDDAAINGCPRQWLIDTMGGSPPELLHSDARIPALTVAFVVDGQLSFGVIYFPNHDEWFTGEMHGPKAAFNGRRVGPGPQLPLAKSLVALLSYRSGAHETVMFSRLQYDLRRLDDAPLLQVGPPNVAMGAWILCPYRRLTAAVYDYNAEVGPLSSRALAAVSAVVQAGGGVFVDERLQAVDPLRPRFTIAASHMAVAERLSALL